MHMRRVYISINRSFRDVFYSNKPLRSRSLKRVKLICRRCSRTGLNKKRVGKQITVRVLHAAWFWAPLALIIIIIITITITIIVIVYCRVRTARFCSLYGVKAASSKADIYRAYYCVIYITSATQQQRRDGVSIQNFLFFYYFRSSSNVLFGDASRSSSSSSSSPPFV